MELFSQIIDTLLPPLIELFSQIIDAIMPVLIELFNTFVEVVLPPLMELIDEIVQVILPPLLAIFNELAEIVLPLVMTVFEAMLPVIEPIMNTIADVIRIVLALIKGDWEEVWNGIESFLATYGIQFARLPKGSGRYLARFSRASKKVVLGVWDGIVDGIKKAINWVIGGINTFIRGLKQNQKYLIGCQLLAARV